MRIDFSKLFHQSSKDVSGAGAVHIPKDSSLWPRAWTTVQYKSYERLEHIALNHSDRQKDLFESISQRSTSRTFRRRPISVEELSTMLKYSCGLFPRSGSKETRRAQPSGGSRYPIEVYAIVFTGGEGLLPGVYHYNVEDHALDVLWQRAFTGEDIAALSGYEWLQQASCFFVMTGVFERNQMKYGERGYRYILLEAGHIGQNLYLTSGALGLGCCALGGTRDENIEKLLDIDGVTESMLYGVAIG